MYVYKNLLYKLTLTPSNKSWCKEDSYKSLWKEICHQTFLNYKLAHLTMTGAQCINYWLSFPFKQTDHWWLKPSIVRYLHSNTVAL